LFRPEGRRSTHGYAATREAAMAAFAKSLAAGVVHLELTTEAEATSIVPS
jgi:hypothetical protein